MNEYNKKTLKEALNILIENPRNHELAEDAYNTIEWLLKNFNCYEIFAEGYKYLNMED